MTVSSLKPDSDLCHPIGLLFDMISPKLHDQCGSLWTPANYSFATCSNQRCAAIYLFHFDSSLYYSSYLYIPHIVDFIWMCHHVFCLIYLTGFISHWIHVYTNGTVIWELLNKNGTDAKTQLCEPHIPGNSMTTVEVDIIYIPLMCVLPRF